MAKDPAFLFYSNDFLTGVADLTFEERGQYITLMALQHQKGHLTEKLIKITVPNVSEDVLAKFKVDKEGNYFNERLELEAKKRAEHSRKQKERALKGWEKRKRQSQNDTTADAAALPLENENVNEDKNELYKGVDSLETEFDIFWKAYGKNVGLVPSQREWSKIDEREYQKIIEHVPKFVKASGNFLKNPENYLKNRCWLDDLPDYSGTKEKETNTVTGSIRDLGLNPINRR